MAEQGFPAFPDDLIRSPEAIAARDSGLEDYGDLESLADVTDESGILDVPAENLETGVTGEGNLLREPVIAERLWLLGYLKSKKDRGSAADIDSAQRYFDAVSAFQREAGLRDDRWVGEDTWTALQKLVSFETSTQVESFFQEDQPLPALVRAVRLRLWTLGLLRKKPKTDADPLRLPLKELSRFWELCTRLNVVPFGSPEPAIPELLTFLFDQDRLIEGVAASSKPSVTSGGHDRLVFKYWMLPSERRKDLDPKIELFLVSLAKIELWLLGFDVKISNARSYPVYMFHRPGDQRRVLTFTKELSRFWHELQEHPEERLCKWITPELFKAFVEPEVMAAARERQKTDEAAHSKEIATALDSDRKVEKDWKRGKSLGMKLWDGLKRIWRWIRRGLLKLLKVGLNRVRALFRYALRAYRAVREAIRTVTSSLVQYIRGEIETGSEVRVLLSGDGDILTHIPAGVSADSADVAAHSMRRFGAAFRLGCKILGQLIRAIRTVVIGGMTGWALLLKVLVDAYGSISPLYRELREIG